MKLILYLIQGAALATWGDKVQGSLFGIIGNMTFKQEVLLIYTGLYFF
jgi:hypothetical protein